MDSTEARRLNAKAKFMESLAQVRKDQLAGKQPMSTQANAANIAKLESGAANLRKLAIERDAFADACAWLGYAAALLIGVGLQMGWQP